MKINYLIYDDMTLLDLVGPMQVWNNFPNVQASFVAKRRDPVTSDAGMVVVPTHDLTDAPASPDILFIPGGAMGTSIAAKDPEIVEFVRAQGEVAGWVTSVCTGALILGAAGLLRGYQAATHWAAMEFLSNFGAEPVDERYVIDRNRATGGGVTAGIDFGLAVMAEIAGEPLARLSQLAIEYTPAPPFASGHPREAEPDTLGAMLEQFDGVNELFGTIQMMRQ